MIGIEIENWRYMYKEVGRIMSSQPASGDSGASNRLEGRLSKRIVNNFELRFDRSSAD